MLKKVSLLSICRVLGHKRSKTAARPMATSWSSKCLICGQRIVRIKRRHWILLNEVRHHAAVLYGPAFALAWPVDKSFCFDELLKRIDARMSETTASQKRTAASVGETNTWKADIEYPLTVDESSKIGKLEQVCGADPIRGGMFVTT